MGWGLLEHRPWARPLAIVVAIIALLNPILGTLLGIYTLWVLRRGASQSGSKSLSPLVNGVNLPDESRAQLDLSGQVLLRRSFPKLVLVSVVFEAENVG